MTTRNLVALALGTGFAVAGPSAFAVPIFQDDFSGNGSGDINGLAPDLAPGGETWVASTGFNADGTVDQAGGSSATLAFTPFNGGVYTLDATILGIAGNGNWFGFGFANGQSTIEGTSNRFLNGNIVQGRAWMMMRGDASVNPSQTFLEGNTSGAAWLGPLANANPGGDVDLRVVLDTTGGAGAWTSTWFAKRPTDGAFTEIRAATLLGNESITSFGFALSNSTANISGTITNLLLDGPVPPNQWAIDGGGSFNTASNWQDNVVPSGSAILGSVLTAANAPATITLDAPTSVTDLSFQNANTYVLDGPSALTLAGAAELNATDGEHFVNALIAGSNGLSKNGEGTIVLTNAGNSYTGGTNVNAGVLDVRHLGAINGSGTIAVTGTLRLNGDGAGGGANGTLAEQVTGSGAVRLEGIDANNPGDGLTTETIVINASNAAFTGNFEVIGGVLSVSNVDALGDTTGVTGIGGGGRHWHAAARQRFDLR